MVDITPLISLQAFIIGFIVVLLIGRAGVEAYEIIKARQNCGKCSARTAHNPAGDKRINPTLQRYYNTYRKGA